MRSFIIHLKGDAKRAPNVQQLLADLPEAEVIDAVNGRDPAQVAGVEVFAGSKLRPTYPFALSPGEVGCFLSHRRCWQRIVDEGLDCALIVEDDLQVAPAQLNRALAMVEARDMTDMFVRLPVKFRERPVQVLAKEGDMTLFLPQRIGLQTACQIVGRGAARRLLAASEAIDRPVDTFLQMHWATGQAVHTILPNGNREMTQALGGSTIQSKVAGRAKLMREVRRAWYRAQVKLRPQKS